MKWEVYRTAFRGSPKERVAVFDTEKEAMGYCEAMDYMMYDEDDYLWDLDYRDVPDRECAADA